MARHQDSRYLLARQPLGVTLSARGRESNLQSTSVAPARLVLPIRSWRDLSASTRQRRDAETFETIDIDRGFHGMLCAQGIADIPRFGVKSYLRPGTRSGQKLHE
eukprot:760523-Hanusia_phi.AAC.6